jgi:hypothetical protein
MAERMEFIALLYQISPDAGADGSPAMVELICSPKNAFLATAKPPAVLSAAAVVLVASVVPEVDRIPVAASVEKLPGKPEASTCPAVIFLFVPVAAIVVSETSTISSRSPVAAAVSAVRPLIG